MRPSHKDNTIETLFWKGQCGDTEIQSRRMQPVCFHLSVVLVESSAAYLLLSGFNSVCVRESWSESVGFGDK